MLLTDYGRCLITLRGKESRLALRFYLKLAEHRSQRSFNLCLNLRGFTLQDRIMTSPLCQYSAEDGHLTDCTFTNLGGIIE